MSQTTPTRDEAVRAADLIRSRIGQEFDGEAHFSELEANIFIRLLLASAPAPASGGGDAVKLDKAAMDWAVDCAHTAGVSASRDDVIGIVYSYLSALSPAAIPGLAMPSREWMRDKIAADPDVEDCGAVPAATPVSEAGSCRCAICGGEHDNDALSDICRRCEETAPWREEPLAKPAAGGDVDWKSLFETAHGALICIAEAQADAHYARKVADELTDATLSQSTSAGRVGE